MEKEVTLVWHEKASCTALQTSSVFLTHTLLVQTHTHDVSAPCYKQLNTVNVIHLFILFNDDSKMHSSCLFVRQIITHKPLERFALNVDRGTW